GRGSSSLPARTRPVPRRHVVLFAPVRSARRWRRRPTPAASDSPAPRVEVAAFEGELPGVEGRTALVSGAATGIGRSVAEPLVGAGAEVIALDCDAAGLDALADELGCETVLADLARVDGEALGEELVDRFGAIPLVINNAGIGNGQNFLDSTPAAF